MKVIRNKNKGELKAQATTGAAIDNESKILGLVQRAASGDFEAFGDLYHIHIERIYRYVFYQVKDKSTAEDITEEIFVKAWKAISSCKGKEQTFSSWLYRIAHNHVIDNIRRLQKRQSIEMETVDKVSSLELKVEGELERQELLKVMACLPQNQRRVIILKFIEGLDNREIGQVMGKSQGAIRVLQMRALATLRWELSSEK
jgi:RNA polymerase sigma-70 factor (ECF subfamily)